MPHPPPHAPPQPDFIRDDVIQDHFLMTPAVSYLFRTPSLHPPHQTVARLSNSPGMGLPLELWLYILTFLARDAMALLTCALTCSHFRWPAHEMIKELRTRTIDPEGYDDLNELVEEVQISPRNTKAIRILVVEGTPLKGTPVALSVIPIRLSHRLISLRKLVLRGFIIDYQPFPSRWTLYGRVFSSVTTLRLEYIRFPLFEDIVSLITSFPTITNLHLNHLSCRYRRVPMRIMRDPMKRLLIFQKLELRSKCSEDQSWFPAVFIHWLVRRNVRVGGVIDFDTLVLSPRSIHSLAIAHALPFAPDDHDDDVVQLTDIPGMGLPLKLWLRIVSFLSHDAASLLACASTCRHFRNDAQMRINEFRHCVVNPSGYDDLNRAVRDIRGIPGNIKAISSLYVIGQEAKSFPVALPVIPYRLSRQLTSLHTLTFTKITINHQLHLSTWMLYGRAFPSVAELLLEEVQFHSFKDFTTLITSFPNLSKLDLSKVSYQWNENSPLKLLQGHRNQELTLQNLHFRDHTSEFTMVFSQWLARRRLQVHLLIVSECVVASECGRRFLSVCNEHVRDLRIILDKTRDAGKGGRLEWLSKAAESFRSGFPNIDSITIMYMNESDISWIVMILPYVVHSLKWLCLWILPHPSEDFDSFSWKRLDVTLSSCFVAVHLRMPSQSNHPPMMPTLSNRFKTAPLVNPSLPPTKSFDHSPIGVDPVSGTAPPIHPSHHTIIRLTNLPGMGLPLEIWSHILTFLARDAISLLACALTCSHFRWPAREMIKRLRIRTIDSSRYDGLNELVAEILNSPRNAKAIRVLSIEGVTPSTSLPPVALSVIPIRLSHQLVSLRELVFKAFTIDHQPFPSRWTLYGRVFSSVTTLRLEHIQFPLFEHIVSLITSFPMVTTLHLNYLSCRYRRVPMRIMRDPQKRPMVLQKLELRSNHSEDQSWFPAVFIHWVVRRNVQVGGVIDFDSLVLSPRSIRSLAVAYAHPFAPENHDDDNIRLTNIPGMGLPLGLWRHIITFLSRDVVSLLAFRDIRGIPGNNTAVSHLSVIGQEANSYPVALPVIPNRLSRQLISLHTLTFTKITINHQLHLSTWILYGCAFPSVAELLLEEVQFHAFKDFTSLVASFPNLSKLDFSKVSYQWNSGSPLKLVQGPRKQKLTLQNLHFREHTSEFTTAFSQWLVWRGLQVHTLIVNECVVASECGHQLLALSYEHIRDLRIILDGTRGVRKGGKLEWLSKTAESFRSGFPNIDSMIIMYMNEADIPWIITILPYLVRSLNWLCLWALPSPSEDFDSFSWKRLDVILYSCFVRHALECFGLESLSSYYKFG
ncbi:hypothetical protein NLI96_g3430 [Meripilus lineatus]|uniref:F-box domain-containing protein n=1 Tax=Meripilus lineatus TaxID=2056292 RepID=A0AAD5V882_9APHY|nr:hypothetical protein NLI96_g3430 [Physisporinus lineatus]